ncbi:MAG: DUF4058 family protein [Phycisphaerales bacterium]|nr:DUF4058 family protein [Phycisphaerales bacterium]
MPSPFPGMDPYLEAPTIFPDLHDRLIAVLGDATFLNLPPGYFAVIGRQAVIDVAEDPIGPDVQLTHARGTGRDAAQSTVASSAASVAPVVIHVPDSDLRRTFVEIYQRLNSTRRLITVIEVLSPSNKAPGNPNRNRYVRKQRRSLSTDVHLVEIDLLRAGRHTTAVPLRELQQRAVQFDYHVCIHRFDRPEDFLIHPLRLREPLPTIDVPLHPSDSDLPVNLQAAFDRCYAAGPYQYEVDYTGLPPKPPLSPDDLAWVRVCVAAASLGS